MNELITIVIPTRNRADRVSAAIGSVLAQTDRNWELIVVDDGSTDDTEAAIRSFDDDRIKYIRQNNQGVSTARNRGIAESRGNLIAFLDSDDRWEPEKLRVQRAFFESHPDIYICQTEEIWIRNGRRVNPMKKHAKPSGWIFKECLNLCLVSPSAVMLRREVLDRIGLFDESLPACEDYDLWLRASLVYEIVTLPEVLTTKMGGHEDQLSRQWGLDCYRIRSLEKLLTNMALPEIYRPLVENQIIERSKIVAEGAMKRGNLELYEEYVQKCTPTSAVPENWGMKPPL
jgi:glycosyltransferase involved in cell wall biosynthesis